MREEIEAETARSLGPGKAIGAEPIMLTVRSPNVPNLTLVDMPGLTKIATDNQPLSIVRELEDMSRHYIKGDNVIILAVSPANADIATSDAMRLVKEFDPDGERTVGVVTKLDLMDAGTDARELLEGKQLYLKHGWFGVVNRSQADINKKVQSAEARRKEREYFKNKPEYADLNCGTDILVTNLTKQLEAAITRAVPKIQMHIRKSIKEMEDELKTFGEMPPDRATKMHCVLTLLAAFEKAYLLLLEGGPGGGRGGEKVRNILEKTLPDSIHALPFSQTFSLRMVKDAIEVADGCQAYLIAPEKSMRRLICDGVSLIRPPTERIVDVIHDALVTMIDQTMEMVNKSNPDMSRFSMLRSTIVRTSMTSLEKFRDETRAFCIKMVEMESSYFTASFFRDAQAQANGRALAAKHGMNAPSRGENDYDSQSYGQSPSQPGLPQYSGSRAGGYGGGGDGGGEGFTPEVEAQLQRISSTVTAYIANMADTLLKNIPKAVIHIQVLQAKTVLLEPLYKQVGGITDEQLRLLLGDDPETAARRETLIMRSGLLRKAQEEILAAL